MPEETEKENLNNKDKTNNRETKHVGTRQMQERKGGLQFKWLGPRRVVDAKTEWVFVVKDLITEKLETVHASRLLLYRADMDGKPVDPALLEVAEHSTTVYEDAKTLRDIRSRGGEIEVQIEWDGLPDQSDLTWEPLRQVHEDLPGLLEDFLASSGQRGLKRKAAMLCSFSTQ